MQRLHDVRGQQAGGTSGTSDTHNQQTSTGTADVKTFTAPKDAVAFLIDVVTTDAWLTLDGTTPTTSNRALIKKDQNPLYVGVGKDVKVAASAAANSIVSVLWLK